MRAFLPLSTLLFLSATCIVHGQKEELRIQVLVPYNNTVFNQEGAIAAVNLAVKDVDARNILADYTIKPYFANTLCDSAEGTWQFIKSILDTDVENATRIIAFVGGGCSLATEPTAALSGRLYEVVQVSYGASSPILSQRNMYPHFYRTITSETLFNRARFAMMKKYNWCYVATLHQTANLFSLTVQDFHDTYNEKLENVTCFDDGPILFSFTGDPEIPLSQIKNKNIRIIFGYFYEDQAISVLCHAHNKGLTSPNHLWVLPAWYSNQWWNLASEEKYQDFGFDCNPDIIQEALENSILLDVYTYPEDLDALSLANYTNATFFETLGQQFKIDNITNNLTVSTQIYSSLAYDAIWALALALNKTEEDLIENENFKLSDFQYFYSGLELSADKEEKEMRNITNEINQRITETLSSKLNSTDFPGVTGRIRFDENGTRIGLTAVFQMLYINEVLTKVLIGTHNLEEDGLNITFDEGYPMWRGDRPPTDRSTPVSKLLSQPLIYVMDTLVAIAIIVAVGLLIFNIVTITKPLTYNSAPYINMIIICGCIIVMIACILLGIDSGTPQYDNGDRDDLLQNPSQGSKDRYAVICTLRLWLLTVGFTLSFGALFCKTWQVYRIYTNSNKKEQPFKMWNFLILMAILLVLDAIILIVWTAAFPFSHNIREDEDDSRDVTNQYEECYCEYFAYLVGAMYVYKGLLVIFGLFLAYESRNVKYFFINDSRFVSVSMYIVVITIGISAPLSLVLAQQWFIDPAYAVAVSMTVASCMSCLLILHIPKFYYFAKGAETMLPQNRTETFTPVDALQLGRSEVNAEDIQSADKKIENLKEQVKQREHELQELQGRRGSDQDSGVLCTSDEKDSPNSPDFATTNTYITSNTTMENNQSTFETELTTVNESANDRGTEEEQIGRLYPSTDSGNDGNDVNDA